MEDHSVVDTVFLLQHPLANPKDPPVAIPTLSRQRQNVLPTPSSLPSTLSPPSSPIFSSSSSIHRHRSSFSNTTSATTVSGNGRGTTSPTLGVSSDALRSRPSAPPLSLARDLTTRLWQREAELQTMKDLYDAKIRRLTEMLQDAGVSPTEVENNLAVVVEEETTTTAADDQQSLNQLKQRQQQQLLVTSDDGLVRTVVGPGRRTAAQEGLFDDCDSTFLLDDEVEGEGEQQGQQEVDDDEDSDEYLSSSGTLSLVSSSCTTQLTKSRPPSNTVLKTDQHHQSLASPALVAMGKYKAMVAGAGSSPSSRRGTVGGTSGVVRPFSPTLSDISTASQLPLPTSRSSVSASFFDAKAQDSETKTHTDLAGQGQGSASQRSANGGQSPIPSFIAESFAAGTLGMKTLRERWAMASGVLSWNRPRQTSADQPSLTRSGSSSIVTSPSGLFIRRDGIINDKKPAVVETSPSPPFLDDLSNLDQDKEEAAQWIAGTNSGNRKLYSKNRPLSEVGFTGTHRHPSKYQSMTTSMARDIPRPPITSIHEYLQQQPESFNPSPLHYRAISMAANLIDTGAITPAKLYARRTQTMIAKWTIGLIMNSKQARSSATAFPIVQESFSSGQEESIGRPSCDKDEDGMEGSRRSSVGMNTASNNGSLSPTELPRALSYRSHATAPNLISSSYPHSSSQYSFHPNHHPSHLHTSQSVVELSDISSPPLSMSPTLSYLGSESSSIKPLTDRYGFLVNARPMAVQQGLLKLNEDLDSPQIGRGGRGGYHSKQSSGAGFEFLKTPAEEEPQSRPVSPPPFFSSFSFGQIAQHGGVATSAISNISSGLSGNIGDIQSPVGNDSNKPVGSHSSRHTGSMTASNSSSGITTSFTSPILSTTTRPMSTLSPPPNSSSAAVTTLLSQIKVLHDSVQMTQKEKWDAFLKKRKRRVHLGETTGGTLGNMSGTNLGGPLLFGNLMMSASSTQDEQDYLQQKQEDEDVMYWTSVCIIGIATIGKGSDWEEFRELTRGGIPVMYRNKIWQEASGAFDLRQPGYYKDLLSRQNPESCPCWGDIEMDLHRTFPTNILFGPGGQGIDKLKNILIAYSLHNPTVGYCQGMNLLAGTLLLTNNSEEESFWILTSMLGRHLPEDYFTQQLLSPQADQRVLKELVQEIMPRLSAHFQEMHVDLTAVTFSWFLTLFTDCLPVETLLRVWDVFFVEGSMLVVFKVALAILWMNEKEIMKCRNGAAVYCFMKQMTLSMYQADKLLKVAFVTLKSYINPEKIEAKRIRQQQIVRQELIQEQQYMRTKTFTCTTPPPPSLPSPSTASKRLSPTSVMTKIETIVGGQPSSTSSMDSTI
ncbi:small G protein signaling modulator 3 [Entomortierella parvispora]|uniref:Small G protein signaling modulator 3 n=1 Tax=Entomortierella parvispora TaxID=205924 RepID=A0A9P3LVM1_9FUNG|nr:small G protein signaling modulator 3 [Entomortierella parvispora]